jgi:hypothetical protein
MFCCELNDKTIHIKEDCNNPYTCQDIPCTFPTGNIISKPLHRVLQFSAKFDQSCKYIMSGTEWQKTMKIVWNTHPDDRSIRLAWRNDNNTEIELGLYGHIGDEDNRTFLSLNHFVDTWEEETLIFSIYPNPSKGNLTIQVPSKISTDSSIEIFNSIGYSIFQKEKVSLSKLSIDISTQPKGIHIVKVIVGDIVYFQKVVLIQENTTQQAILHYIVEAYIAIHHHLPNIPSESEVLENGISLGEMNALLMQKIEELSLYVFQLKQEIEENKLKIEQQ